jgi:hypothetical protein
VTSATKSKIKANLKTVGSLVTKDMYPEPAAMERMQRLTAGVGSEVIKAQPEQNTLGSSESLQTP